MIRYMLQRLGPLTILPITGLLLLGSVVAASEPLTIRLCARFILGVLFVCVWRLRDDLYSVPDDRLAYPWRVLTAAKSLTPYYAVVGLGWVVAMVGTYLLHGWFAMFALWGLSLVLEIIYGWRIWSRKAMGLKLATATLKYGGLTMILAGGAQAWFWSEGWSAVALVCATFASYELIEDRGFDRWSWRAWWLSLSLMCPGVVYLMWCRGHVNWWIALPLGLWATWNLSVGTRPTRAMQVRLAPLVFVVNAVILVAILYIRRVLIV